MVFDSQIVVRCNIVTTGPRWVLVKVRQMKHAYNCPDCLKPLWAMLCGARLAPSDLIVCVACEFVALVGGQVIEPAMPLELDDGLWLVP